MRNRLVSVAAMIVCLLAMSACADPFFGILGDSGASTTAVPLPTTALSGSSWRLKQLQVDGKAQPLVSTAPVTLQFQREDSVYIGSSGCNYYTGAYVVTGNRLSLKFKSVTQVACAGPIMSQEVAYLNAMGRVRGYQLSGQGLILKDGDGGAILAFTAA